MQTSTKAVVFFDIGETLGGVHLDAHSGALLRIDVFPYVRQVLASLKERGVTLGIISNTGDETADRVNEVLAEGNILHFFEAGLRIYSSEVGLQKDSTEIFELAIGRAAAIVEKAAGCCIFVGESRAERQLAKLAGMRAVPHPRLANAAVRGEQIQVLRLEVDGGNEFARLATILQNLDAVPLYVSQDTPTVVVLQGTTEAALVLQRSGFSIDVMANAPDPVTHDLYLLRSFEQDLDPRSPSFAALSVAECDDVSEGRLIALPPNRSIDDFHCGRSHGHNFKLLCDESLVSALSTTPSVGEEAEPILSDEEVATIASAINEETYREMLDRVTGNNPDWPEIGDNRHVLGGELDQYGKLLAAEFERIGRGRLEVSAHSFSITSKDIKDVKGLPVGKRVEVSNIVAELPGQTDELVLVTAHLDSTAASSHLPGEYDPPRHPAPGVDDDGSGVAGVLLAADTMLRLFAHVKPKRTFRFVLFTAEEQGLIGSERYARLLRARGEDVVAVFQMDMIGYNVLKPNTFETHCGVSRTPLPSVPPVEHRSRRLAERIAAMSRLLADKGLSILEPVQLYVTPDGAAGRSDHASFQRRNYPGCVTSEDFFPDPDRPSEPNPHYHKASDLVVDLPYATSISRVVTAAALRTAEPVVAGALRADMPATAARAIVASGGATAAGERTVTGTVNDDKTGAPLAQAKLLAYGIGETGKRELLARTKAKAGGQFSVTVPANRALYFTIHGKDGHCIGSTHEVPLPACATDCATDIRVQADQMPLAAREPSLMRVGGRWRSRKKSQTLTPQSVCEIARGILGRGGTARSGVAETFDFDVHGDDPLHTLCATEPLEDLFALIEAQDWDDRDAVLEDVYKALDMRDLGYAQKVYATDNFEIRYYTDGPGAVEEDYDDFVVFEPGSDSTDPIATLPAGDVPAYVRLVGFWLERSLRTYTDAPFLLRNPASGGRLRAFIIDTDFGAASPAGFYIGNRLTPAFVCAVSVHELFHMVQYGYDGGGAWRGSVFEGGATFAEDFLADRMNRYLVEAGAAFNGVGLLANPNQSLFSNAARYKSALFWRYLAEQLSDGSAGGPVAVEVYRRVIEECSRVGYTTAAVSDAIADVSGQCELYRFTYLGDGSNLLDSSETAFGNFALACLLKELGDDTPDARFDFSEENEQIHFDDALREIIPDIPHVEDMVDVARRRNSLKPAKSANFTGHVNALASEFLEIDIDGRVESVELRFEAGTTLSSSIFQIVLVDESGQVRDIIRSDRARYHRRLANQRAGVKLSRIVCIVSGGNTRGTYSVTATPAESAPDIAITRWNSQAGKEYQLAPKDWSWSWVSPDLWFTRAGNRSAEDLQVNVRLHNKGNVDAAEIAVDLFYRPGSNDDEWLPIRNADGKVQRLEGLSLAAGDSGTWSAPWAPSGGDEAEAYTLLARVHAPGDDNLDNKVALSRMALADLKDPAVADLTYEVETKAGMWSSPVLHAATGTQGGQGAVHAVFRGHGSSSVAFAPNGSPDSIAWHGPDPMRSVAVPTEALPEPLRGVPAVTIRRNRLGKSSLGITFFQL